jgi:ASC-1-like (ASCH) protein
MKEKITEKSTLKEVLTYDGLEEVLRESGFPCVSCPMAQMEMD